MKKLILSTLALLALLATPQARAWNYTDGDLLLVFRASGHNDIEFDLGGVTNLLGKTNGYTTAITGWDTSLVTTEFGTDLTGVSVVLLAVSSTSDPSPTAWLSSSEPNTTAYRDNLGDWTSNLHSTINAIGKRPLNPVPIPATEPNAYSINPSAKQAYDYLVSGGTSTGLTALPQFGGHAPFTVEQAAPGRLDFWAIQPTNAVQVPDKLIGTFTIAADGTLTFVAGPSASSIVGITRSGNVSSVQFTTTVGNTYSLAYTNTLVGPVSSWPVDGTTLIGDGNVDTLNHTNSSNAEFYQIGVQ
jgi:hypothetical protein